MSSTHAVTRSLPTTDQIARRRQRISSNWSTRERSQRAQQASAAIKTLWSMITRPSGE